MNIVEKEKNLYKKPATFRITKAQLKRIKEVLHFHNEPYPISMVIYDDARKNNRRIKIDLTGVSLDSYHSILNDLGDILNEVDEYGTTYTKQTEFHFQIILFYVVKD